MDQMTANEQGSTAASAGDQRQQETDANRLDAQEPSQAELAVMHPDGDDPEWRYYFGAWHS